MFRTMKLSGSNREIYFVGVVCDSLKLFGFLLQIGAHLKWFGLSSLLKKIINEIFFQENLERFFQLRFIVCGSFSFLKARLTVSIAFHEIVNGEVAIALSVLFRKR